jgi:formamidopyrimidine-DNA glycosylase
MLRSLAAERSAYCAICRLRADRRAEISGARVGLAANSAVMRPMSCQTGGKLLADRSLSRLLRDDWPKTLAELDERSAQRK